MVELRTGSKALTSQVSFVAEKCRGACAPCAGLNTLQFSDRGRWLDGVFATFEFDGNLQRLILTTHFLTRNCFVLFVLLMVQHETIVLRFGTLRNIRIEVEEIEGELTFGVLPLIPFFVLTILNLFQLQIKNIIWWQNTNRFSQDDQLPPFLYICGDSAV